LASQLENTVLPAVGVAAFSHGFVAAHLFCNLPETDLEVGPNDEVSALPLALTRFMLAFLLCYLCVVWHVLQLCLPRVLILVCFVSPFKVIFVVARWLAYTERVAALLGSFLPLFFYYGRSGRWN
jgi:hypothetical protein